MNIYRPKTLAIILQIANNKDEQNYCSNLAQQTKTTTPHVFTILKKFIELKLIIKDISGRNHCIVLTTSGKRVAKLISELNNLTREV